MYNLIQLKKSLELLANNEYQDTLGAYCLDSNTEGPIVGISVMTHGNEPSGLAAFQYFLDNKIKPEKGKIIFILNNIQASQLYFESGKIIDEEEKFRFVDVNFNRLPEHSLSLTESEAYEIKRLHSIYPLIQTFDFGLDIHSTTTDATPTIINISDDLTHGLFAGFPEEMEIIISNMANVQKGYPICHFFGGLDKDIPSLGIETGIHVAERSFQIAIESTLQFCVNCGILPVERKLEKRKFRNYNVLQSILFPSEDFYANKSFMGFEELTRDQPLGSNGINQIKSPYDCLTLFGCPKNYKPKVISDEVFFLVDFPQIIEL